MVTREKLIAYCDQIIFVCLCFLIFFLPFAKAGVETFTWMAIFLWLFKRVLGYRPGSVGGMFPVTVLNKALGIFIAVNAVSMVFSSNFGLSARGFFGKELKFIAIYFMLVESISTKKRLKAVLFTIIASALLVTVDAAVQIYRGRDFLRGYPYDTFSACFYAATGFAGWLIVIIPVLCGIVLKNTIFSWKLKIFLLATVIIQSLYLLKTLSRGAWVGFLVAISLMSFYIVKRLNLKFRILCVCGTACLLVLILFLPQEIMFKIKDVIRVKLNLSQTISQRIGTISQTDMGSVSERIMWWKESLRIIRDFPLVGCGINTYSIVARKYKSFEGGGTYPHNSYLQKSAETGILGLLAFLWVLFLFFKAGFGQLKKKFNALLLGLISAVAAFSVHAFFDTHLYSLQLVVLFWYMLGLTIAVIKMEENNLT